MLSTNILTQPCVAQLSDYKDDPKMTHTNRLSMFFIWLKRDNCDSWIRPEENQ